MKQKQSLSKATQGYATLLPCGPHEGEVRSLWASDYTVRESGIELYFVQSKIIRYS